MIPIPRIFEGRPCVVVAGGPSLKGFDWARLEDKNVIAINRAYEFLPRAEVLYWSDEKFWRLHRDQLNAHPALWKATLARGYAEEDLLPKTVKQYRVTGVAGFDPAPGCIRHGNSSGFAAIHLAAHLGASSIILLGLDMKHGANGETHFHGGHGRRHYEESLTELMLPWFKTLAAPLAAAGISVINASPASALTVWPRVTIDEGLAVYVEKAYAAARMDQGAKAGGA